MPTELDAAAAALEEAADAAADGDLRSRLAGLARTLDELAAAEDGPDEDRLTDVRDRLGAALDEADGIARERAEAAHDHLLTYTDDQQF